MWLVQWKNTDCASIPNMDVTISAQTFSDVVTTPLGVAAFIVAVVCLALFMTGVVMPSDLLAGLGAFSSIFLTVGLIFWAINHVEHQKEEAVASMVATISDQYEISSLTNSGEDHIEVCTPGSPADREQYSWFSENPKALHEGVLVKTAEVDGACSYTLYSQSKVTPVAVG